MENITKKLKKYPKSPNDFSPRSPHLCVKNSLLLISICVLLFANCRSENNLENQQTQISTREITDDLGRTVKIPAEVKRAVSLAPNLTEMIFAAGGGDRLVGVTSFCNYPEQAQKITKVGDTLNPNLEAIFAQKPDIVFVSTTSQIENFTRRMQENGIAVFVTDAKNLEDVLRNLRQIGDIFGTKETAENIIAELAETHLAHREQSQRQPDRKSFRAD